MTCIVVGGGLLGLLTAYELALADVDVLVLERHEPGQESSWAGGGILSPLYPWRYPDAVSELARWSQQHYPDFADHIQQASGIDPEWTQSGLLILDGEIDAAQTWAQRFDVSLSVLDESALHQQEPALSKLGVHALHLPDVAQLRNPRLLKALRKTLQTMGVEIRSQSEVNGFEVRGGRVCGVKVNGQSLAAEQVVVASGAWSGDLLANLGLKLEVYPVKGQMLLFRTEPDVLQHILLYKDRYLIPRRDGRILMGSTMEHVGFEKLVDDEIRGELSELAVAMVPRIAHYPIERHWAGLRPGSPDGVPFIGPHPALTGLYINAGHFRNGVVMGYASARLLVDQMLERTPILDVSPYLPT